MPPVEITECVRVFRYKGEDLPDPAPSQSPEKALELLSINRAELNNAVVEPPESEDGKLVYPIKKSIGTKG